jgi:ketosteroid isomerase-like protein
MKNFNVVIAIIVLVLFQTADRAAAQCRNGMCPSTNSSSYYSTPAYTNTPAPEGKVSVTQELGPVEKQIVKLEKDALDKWYSGDPSAYIANIGSEIGYFEPILEKRLDGLEPLRKMYEALRGRVHADKYDMLNTRVQMVGDAAILSFNLISIENGVPFRWNCTEVFAKEKDGQWKIVHSHWSVTKPRPY